MINQRGQNALNQFLENPNKESEQLLDIPHVYQLLRLDRQQSGGNGYSARVLSVCQWLLNRSTAVLGELLKNSPPTPAGLLATTASDDWETVRALPVLFAFHSGSLF